MENVLKKKVIGYINMFLNKYLEPIEGKGLDFSLMNGKCSIADASLRPQALMDLNLPVQVLASHIESLSIDFPFPNIWGKNWKLEMSGLHILIEPLKSYNKGQKDYLQEQMEEKLQEINKSVTHTWSDQIIAMIIENLTITLKNVNIRYDNAIENQAFAIGATLYELCLFSSDMLRTQDGLCEKTGQIKNFQIYLDTNPVKLFSSGGWSAKEALKNFKLQADHRDTCVIGPVSCETKAVLWLKPWWEPKYNVKLIFTEFKGSINRSQFKTIHLLGQMYDMWSKGRPYQHLHPGIENIHGVNGGKERWKFAINCIKEDIHKKNIVWSWKRHFEPNRRHRYAYKLAYEKKLRGESLNKNEEESMKEAERFLTLFVLKKTIEEAQNSVKDKVKSRNSMLWSFFSWPFGPKAMASEELEKDLQEVIELRRDIPDVSQKYFPDSRTQLVVFIVENFEYLIRNDELKKNVLEMKVKGMKFDFSKKPLADSIRMEVILKHFLLTNGNERDLQTLVKRHHSGENEGSDSRVHSKDPPPLLSILYETNLDGEKEKIISCDHKLIVKTLPLDIYLSSNVCNDVRQIFIPPNTYEFDQLNAGVHAVQQSLAILEYFKKERDMKMFLDIEMQGSYVILPETKTNVEGKRSYLVANLGTLKIDSIKNAEWKKKRHRKSGELTAKELIDISYDVYKAVVKDTHVFCVLEQENWDKQIEDNSYSLLEKTTLDLEVKMTHYNKVTAPRIIVTGKLPPLYVNLVDKHVAQCLKIVNTWVLEFKPNSNNISQDQQNDLSSQEASLNQYNTIQPLVNKKEIKTKENVKMEVKKEYTILKESDVTTKMKVKADFDLSSITFNIIHLSDLKKHSLMTLKITEISLNANIFKTGEQFRFGIGTLEIKDTRTENPYYDRILHQLGDNKQKVLNNKEKVLDIKVDINSLKDDDLRDFSKHHVNLNVTAARLQLCYLSGFIEDMVAFNSYLSISKNTALADSQIITEKTIKNLQDLFRTRVKFNVCIDTPVVICPQSLTESSVIVLNLGNLTLENEFVREDDYQGTTVIYDHITAKLEKFKLSLAMYENGKVHSERFLIEPITFNADIKRYILKSKETDSDIVIESKLDKIPILLKETDLPTFLRILSGNMNEAGIIDKMKENLPGERSALVSEVSTTVEVSTESISHKSTLIPTLSLGQKTTTIKAKVTLDGLKVLLFKGSANSSENELATEMHVFQVVNDFSMFSDGSIKFTSELQGFKMTDCRQDVSIKYRELISSKTTKTDQGEKTLVITVLRETQGNLDFTGTFAGMKILLCLPYYLKLLSYLVVDDKQSKAFVPKVSISTGFPSVQTLSSPEKKHIYFYNQRKIHSKSL